MPLPVLHDDFFLYIHRRLSPGLIHCCEIADASMRDCVGGLVSKLILATAWEWETIDNTSPERLMLKN